MQGATERKLQKNLWWREIYKLQLKTLKKKVDEVEIKEQNMYEYKQKGGSTNNVRKK